MAWAITRTKDDYLAAQYQRLEQRRGVKRSAMAIAHNVLRIIYYMLRDGSNYKDLGAAYFEELDKMRIQQHRIRRLEQVGYAVTLSSADVA